MGANAVIRPLGQGEIIRSGISHVKIVNQFSGEEQEVIINPTSLPKRIQARYSEKHPIMSAPGKLVYEATTNAEIPLRLEADADLFPKRSILDFWIFMESLLYPVRLGDLIGDPPDVLLIWPNLLSILVKVTQVNTTFTEFATNLKAKAYQMDVVVKEVGQTLVFSDDVRERIQIIEPLPVSFLPGQGEWY